MIEEPKTGWWVTFLCWWFDHKPWPVYDYLTHRFVSVCERKGCKWLFRPYLCPNCKDVEVQNLDCNLCKGTGYTK